MPDALRLALQVQGYGIRLTASRSIKGRRWIRLGGADGLLPIPLPDADGARPPNPHACLVASPSDIACMKLLAIASAHQAGDFVDVFVLSRHIQRWQNRRLSSTGRNIQQPTFFMSSRRLRTSTMLTRSGCRDALGCGMAAHQGPDSPGRPVASHGNCSPRDEWYRWPATSKSNPNPIAQSVFRSEHLGEHHLVRRSTPHTRESLFHPTPRTSHRPRRCSFQCTQGSLQA